MKAVRISPLQYDSNPVQWGHVITHRNFMRFWLIFESVLEKF